MDMDRKDEEDKLCLMPAKTDDDDSRASEDRWFAICNSGSIEPFYAESFPAAYFCTLQKNSAMLAGYDLHFMPGIYDRAEMYSNPAMKRPYSCLTFKGHISVGSDSNGNPTALGVDVNYYILPVLDATMNQ